MKLIVTRADPQRRASAASNFKGAIICASRALTPELVLDL